MSPSADPVDDVEGILAALLSHQNMSESSRRQQGLPGSGFPYPPDTKRFWVKYSYNGKMLRHEANMQSFVHERLIDLHALRIPKVYRIHDTPDKTNGVEPVDCDLLPWTFMVMEYVEATPVKKIIAHKPDGADERELQEKISARVADALLSLIALRPPTDMAPAPGPLYGGRMSYLVWDFEDPVAPKDYHSVQELQDDINERINSKYKGFQADFSKDLLCLCFGDVHETNFLIDDPADPESTLTIIDFEHTNFLPLSFLMWELYYRNDDPWLHPCEDSQFYDRIIARIEAALPENPTNQDNIQALHRLLRVCELSHSIQWSRASKGQ